MDISYLYMAILIVSVILLMVATYLHLSTPHQDYHSIMFIVAGIGMIASIWKLSTPGMLSRIFNKN